MKNKSAYQLTGIAFIGAILCLLYMLVTSCSKDDDDDYCQCSLIAKDVTQRANDPIYISCDDVYKQNYDKSKYYSLCPLN